MKKIGIFYGSTTGTTEHIAKEIASDMGIRDIDIHDVRNTSPSVLGDYDVILIGSSTWGDGEIQDDMHDFIDGAGVVSLKGKYVGVFGCGDDTMSETFCNAVGKIYDAMKKTGATMVGDFNADGYEFDHSDAEINGRVVGLLIDNVNHDNLTSEKIKEWTDEIIRQIA